MRPRCRTTVGPAGRADRASTSTSTGNPISTASLLLAAFAASGGVASAAETCTVDTTSDVGTFAEVCSLDTDDVSIACSGGGGDGGGGC